MTKQLGMSRKQMMAYSSANARVNVFEGSIRAGKTFSWLLIMLTKIKNAGSEGAIVIIGKNRDSIYRNVFEPLETIPALAEFTKHVEYRQGAATARFFGRTVHVIGANDGMSENKIRGMTIQQSYCDEITVLDQAFFKQLLGRMSIDGAQLFGTTNPDGPGHWLKAYLDRIDGPGPNGEKQIGNWRRFHFTIDDNPSLSEAYKNSMRSEYTGLWYRRFILGQWVAAEGAVFDSWDQEKHVVPWSQLPQMKEFFGVGIDYGTTNATAAIVLGLGYDGILYAVDEWRYQATSSSFRKTDSQLSADIREWLAKSHLPAPDGKEDGPILDTGPVIVDPAAASFRVQMKQDGIHTHPGENDVMYGIRLMASLIASGKFKVSDRCRGLINEMPGYSWDPKATERGNDAPIKVADHSIDSLRYVIATTEKRWRRYINLSLPMQAESDLDAA